MIGTLFACVALFPSSAGQVLDRAHSHNDYNRPRPLLQALECGFGSIEIDVFPVNGKLYVAHDRIRIDPAKTIESLYLDPLVRLIRTKSGRFAKPQRAPLWILVDIKADAVSAYPILKALIESRPELHWNSGKGAVRFLISGDRPIDLLVADCGSFAGLDGRWSDLGNTYSSEFMPWVSESWLSHFKWLGAGSFPYDQQSKLAMMIDKVHSQKRKLRFWGTPDTPALWNLQKQRGVDLIGTDRPNSFRNWWSQSSTTKDRQELELGPQLSRASNDQKSRSIALGVRIGVSESTCSKQKP